MNKLVNQQKMSQKQTDDTHSKKSLIKQEETEHKKDEIKKCCFVAFERVKYIWK